MPEPKLEFVNDVERLEWAVSVLDKAQFQDRDRGEWDCNSWHIEEDEWDAVDIMTKYVPILIKSYEELFKESMNLTAAWEAYIENRTPEGLYLPSTRIEA